VPRREKGLKPARSLGLHVQLYIEVLKEPKVGNATMREITPAITQRTNRAIVFFTAE
jgi:hypothetical protein